MDIVKVLMVFYPTAEYSCGETYESLDWISTGIEKPTEAVLLGHWDYIVANWATIHYASLRRKAYLPFGEQLDMMYRDKRDGTNLWEEHIENVKMTYPKPEEI